jgi:alkylation response protein AidB-like acyl-CoA dehydrogenase
VTGPAPAAAPTADHPDFGETVTAVLGDDLPGILATLSGLQSRFSASADQASADQAGPGHRLGLMEESGPGELAVLARARELQRALFESGLGWPQGPVELGGGGHSKEWSLALDRVLDAHDLPPRGQLLVGLHIVAPAIAGHGSAELRRRYLPALFRGDIVGCQLFSEPSSGSDLASARTSARRDGDEWIVSGQKVWTSGGHFADIGELLVRTDPGAGKHAGLSMLIVDMGAPGVTVRPLRQMTGGSAFCEVFLDEVLVPDANRIGELGAGWSVARTSLRSEREAMTSGLGPLSPYILSSLRALVARADRGGDPVIAQQVARACGNILAAQSLAARGPDDWGRLGPLAGSVSKLMLVETIDLIGRLVAELGGPSVFLDEDETFLWSEFVLGAPSLHIAGGTDEIQRNLIAQRGLGLPR